MFYKDKKVLVTGGTGFVGLHIVQELLKEGARVRIPVHRRPLVIRDERIETVPADLTNPQDCLRVLKDIEICFHAAGAVAAAAVTAGNPMEAIIANLVLTSRMLQAAWTAGTDRFLVFGSSTGYPAADYPIKEDEMWSGPTHPSYFGYGWMRRYLERLAEYVASKSKVKIALMRPTAVYGRWDNFDLQTAHVIPALVRKAVERADPYEVWGTGDEVRDFLHVSDLARACVVLAEKHAVCDPVNIGYGKVVRIKEIVENILKSAGYSKARVVFNASKPTAIPFRMVDTSKAKKLLGFEPQVTLEEGLEDTVQWYQRMRGKI
jgi:GDP-L-fucose synthase